MKKYYKISLILGLLFVCFLGVFVVRQMQRTSWTFQEGSFFYTGYEIKEIDRINDHLYVLTVELEKPVWDQKDGQRETVYNFVAQIDGKKYYMNNVRNVPEAVQEGLDRDKYATSGEDGLTLDNIQDLQMGD